MPYIEKKYREKMDKEVDALALIINVIFEFEKSQAKAEGRDRFQTKDGLMNYAITRILNQLYPEANYHEMNEMIGMLECCKLEAYRKTVAPYEDLKESVPANGPVPTFTKAQIQEMLKNKKS